jgi:protein-tyrosine phosphatase
MRPMAPAAVGTADRGLLQSLCRPLKRTLIWSALCSRHCRAGLSYDAASRLGTARVREGAKRSEMISAFVVPRREHATESSLGDTVEWGSGQRLRVRESYAGKSRFDSRSGQVRATRIRATRNGMDIIWLTERIAIGGGIWNAGNMAKVATAGITHIVDMQTEFDDTVLAAEHGITVLWNPTDDDFEPKPAALFRRGVSFVEAALADGDAKVFIHCAAGVHRAPMMALAVLARMGWDLEDAMDLIEARRPVADFAEVYVRSVEKFLDGAGSTRIDRNS